MEKLIEQLRTILGTNFGFSSEDSSVKFISCSSDSFFLLSVAITVDSHAIMTH
jgi:hypothetical protein